MTTGTPSSGPESMYRIVRRFVLTVFDRTPAGKFMALSFVVRMPSPHCPGTWQVEPPRDRGGSLLFRRLDEDAFGAGEAVRGDGRVEVGHCPPPGVAQD